MLRLMNHWGAMPENTNQKEFSYILSIFKGAKHFKRDDEQSNNKVNYLCCENKLNRTYLVNTQSLIYHFAHGTQKLSLIKYQ
jgi:hypothetical protein